MQMENSIPIFGNGNASGKFHSRLSGRELEADIPRNSRDREFPLMVEGGRDDGRTEGRSDGKLNHLLQASYIE